MGEADLMELERRLQEKTGLLREGLQLVASLPTIDTSSPPPRDQVRWQFTIVRNVIILV